MINYIRDNYWISSQLYIKFSTIAIFNHFIIKISTNYSSIIYYQKNNFLVFDCTHSRIIPLIIQQSIRNLHRIHIYIYRTRKSNILSNHSIQYTMIMFSSILTVIITFVTVYHYHSIQKRTNIIFITNLLKRYNLSDHYIWYKNWLISR